MTEAETSTLTTAFRRAADRSRGRAQPADLTESIGRLTPPSAPKC